MWISTKKFFFFFHKPLSVWFPLKSFKLVSHCCVAEVFYFPLFNVPKKHEPCISMDCIICFFAKNFFIKHNYIVQFCCKLNIRCTVDMLSDMFEKNDKIKLKNWRRIKSKQILSIWPRNLLLEICLKENETYVYTHKNPYTDVCEGFIHNF